MSYYLEDQLYIVKGITTSTHPRLEVNLWAANYPIQLSLFVRALQRFYDIRYDSKVSFHRVAGKSWSTYGLSTISSD